MNVSRSWVGVDETARSTSRSDGGSPLCAATGQASAEAAGEAAADETGDATAGLDAAGVAVAAEPGPADETGLGSRAGSPWGPGFARAGGERE